MPGDQVVLLDNLGKHLRTQIRSPVQKLLAEWIGFDPEAMTAAEGHLCYSDLIALVASVEAEATNDTSLNFAAPPLGTLLAKLVNNPPTQTVAQLQLPWPTLDTALGGMAQVLAGRGDEGRPLDGDFLRQLADQLEALLTEIEEGVEDEKTVGTLRRAVEQILRGVRRAMLLGPSELRKGAFEAAQTLEYEATTNSGEGQPRQWREVAALAIGLVTLGLTVPPAIEAGANLVERLSNDNPDLVVEVRGGWNPPALPPGASADASPSD